jgi:outer membrane murein-binding lipoprotein Lpp
MLTEVAKLQSDGEYLKRDLNETRSDMKDMRDRMARLEVRVDHLPSKGFIVTAIAIGVAILSGVATVAPKIQSLLGINH